MMHPPHLMTEASRGVRPGSGRGSSRGWRCSTRVRLRRSKLVFSSAACWSTMKRSLPSLGGRRVGGVVGGRARGVGVCEGGMKAYTMERSLHCLGGVQGAWGEVRACFQVSLGGS